MEYDQKRDVKCDDTTAPTKTSPKNLQTQSGIESKTQRLLQKTNNKKLSAFMVVIRRQQWRLEETLLQKDITFELPECRSHTFRESDVLTTCTSSRNEIS